MKSQPEEEIQRDFGTQPLDRWMREWGLSNRDLVSVSTEQLTHKQVQKARKGRRVSLNIQNKIKNALEKSVPESQSGKTIAIEELFNYRG